MLYALGYIRFGKKGEVRTENSHKDIECSGDSDEMEERNYFELI